MKLRGYVVNWSRLFGLMDSITGLGLIFLPGVILRIMGLTPDIYTISVVMVVGAFVFAVGNLYFMGLMLSRREESYYPLRCIWNATAWVRVCVSMVMGYLVFSGGLEKGWVTVALTDSLVGIGQLATILLGWFPSNE